MIFTRVIACVSMLMLALGASAEEAAAQPTELKIDRTFVPEDCTVTAQKGDKLHMHYVSPGTHFCHYGDTDIDLQTGKLWTNGNKFDSR